MHKLTVSDVEERIKSMLPDGIKYIGLVSTEWKGAKEIKARFYCEKHKREFILEYQTMFGNLGIHCPECSKETRYSEHSEKLKKNNEKSALNRIKEFFNAQKHLEFLGFEGEKYDGIYTRVRMRCLVHNVEFSSVYRTITKEKFRSGKEKFHCPECIREDFSNRTPTWIMKDESEAVKEIENRLPNHIKFIGWDGETFPGSVKAKAKLYCTKHDKEFVLLYRYILELNKTTLLCPECRKEIKEAKKLDPTYKPKIKILEDESKERLNTFLRNNPHIEIIKMWDKYDGVENTKIDIRCKKHNVVLKDVVLRRLFKQKLLSGESKYHCPKCTLEQIAESKKITPEEAYDTIIEKIKESGVESKYDYSKIKTTYTDSQCKVTITCPEHGDFEVNFSTLMKNGKGELLRGNCPICNRIKILYTEEKCKNIIEKYIPKDKIKTQYFFKVYDNICNKSRKIFVDFYIEDLNLIIEYDGIQHFEFRDFYYHGNCEKFINQVNRDNCLNNFCKSNSINLLRITYKDNDRLEEVIKSFFIDGKDITTKVDPILLPIKYEGGTVNG